MIELPGYRHIEPLAETLSAMVYKAISVASQTNVVIKILKVKEPPPSDVARFKHEYEMIRKANPAGVAAVLDIIFSQGRLVLVLEDCGYSSLKDYLRGKRPMELTRFLAMAISLADVINQLHRHNITHRDIRPANILYDPATDIFKLDDFGIMAELTGINEYIYQQDIMEGSLAYIAPEQTGRMNCGVDYRTDFYALGATFYEMLTGGVPFAARDPMEMIHAHIAKIPVPPPRINPHVPQTVSDIVMKLLAKAVEDRYQSGSGLLSDLKRCREQLEHEGCIEDFRIGRHDMSPKFNLPQILVGRKEEFETLRQTFELASKGKLEVLMVSGDPGIGKSALINELQKPVMARRGYFMVGKYDQLRQRVPYSGIIQAIQSLTRQLLTESEERIARWKKSLVAALGPNGKIITDIIAEMEVIVGKQPAMAELSPEEAQNRFKMVLKSFMRVFTSVEHPVVLFLDDLQWADPASLDLLQTLILDQQAGALFIIGAFRDSETPAHHPLMQTLDRIHALGIKMKNIRLNALNSESVNSFLNHCLHCGLKASEPLALAVHAKTLGNPFFINHFLKRLNESNYLQYIPGIGWQWDTTAIEKMQVTENVVNFMAEKLQDLPKDRLALLQIGACIGNRFDSETLTTITGISVEDVFETLDDLIQAGMIVYRERFYRFQHDRIRETAYSLLNPDEKAFWHYRIGYLALEKSDSDALLHDIFYIADQLNFDFKLLQTQQDRTRLAEINLKAGIKAKDSTAYDAAVTYLKAGRSLLGEFSFQTTYRLAYDIHLELMESQYLARNFEEAERLFEIIITHAADKIDKANAINTMIVLYTNTREPVDAINLGLSGLRLFGINLKLKVGVQKVLWELIKAKWKLRRISMEAILALPVMQAKDRIAHNNIMFNIATPAYYVNPNLFAFVALKGLNESLRYGLPEHAAATFITVATISENVLGDYKLGYEMGQAALLLNQKLDNRKLSGMVHHIFAFFIQHWNRHAKYDLPYFSKVFQLCLDYGNYIYAGHSVNASADCRLIIGHPLEEIARENDKYRAFMDQVKDPFIVGRYRENTQFIRTLQGINQNPVSLTGQDFDETAHLAKLKQDNNLFGLAYTWLFKAKLFYLFGHYDDARKAAEELNNYLSAAMGTMLVSDHYYYYSLILAAQLGVFKPRQRHRARRIILANQRKLAKWAASCPENFRHKYDLVQAEVVAAGKDFWKAPLYYHAAIRAARRNQYLNDEAIACEKLALFYHRFNVHEEACLFMQLAHQCYGYWGAIAKQRDLETQYAALLTDTPNVVQKNDSMPLPAMEITSRHLDFSTVIKVSQAISGEILHDQLVPKIMQLSIANAGAQRGFLILKKQGDLHIELYEDLDPTAEKITPPIPMENCRGLCHAIVYVVARSLLPIILSNAAKEGEFTNDTYVATHQCKSILCMPILNKGELLGVLYMENNLTANAFTSDRLEILGVIAAQAAISLENARLFELATTDGMTKLYVHRYFKLLLDREIERSSRYEHTFALVMIDIDNFKHFNDTHGHQAGDDVLRRVGGLLRENIRSMDIAARYGGEEFVLILPETDLHQALFVCEKIRQLVETMPIPYEDKILNVTISLGVSIYPHHAMEKNALISSADGALYLSKAEGKNRVSVGDKRSISLIRKQQSVSDAAAQGSL